MVGLGVKLSASTRCDPFDNISKARFNCKVYSSRVLCGDLFEHRAAEVVTGQPRAKLELLVVQKASALEAQLMRVLRLSTVPTQEFSYDVSAVECSSR